MESTVALPAGYLNPGLGKRFHRLTDRSCLPESFDDDFDGVFGFRIVVVFTVWCFDPAYGKLGNSLASFCFSESRLHHYFGSFTILKTTDHSHHLGDDRIVGISGIGKPSVTIE